MTFGTIGAFDMMHHWTARDYVRDGLVAMWDGIENAGWGVHDPNATGWKNLTNPTKSFDWSSYAGGGVVWEGDCLKLDNGDKNFVTLDEVASVTGLAESEPKTVELVAAFKWVYMDNVLNIQNPFILYGANTPISRDLAWSMVSYYDQRFSICDTRGNVAANSWLAHTAAAVGVPGTGDKTLYVDGAPETLAMITRNHYTASFTNDTARLGRPARADVRLYRATVYSRALTAAEIAYNYNIDKLRFNLP